MTLRSRVCTSYHRMNDIANFHEHLPLVTDLAGVELERIDDTLLRVDGSRQTRLQTLHLLNRNPDIFLFTQRQRISCRILQHLQRNIGTSNRTLLSASSASRTRARCRLAAWRRGGATMWGRRWRAWSCRLGMRNILPFLRPLHPRQLRSISAAVLRGFQLSHNPPICRLCKRPFPISYRGVVAALECVLSQMQTCYRLANA